MQLSVGQILDYKNCPQLYKFRHIDLLPEKKELEDYFREALRQTISYYYFCMIDKKEKSLTNLFSKWEMLWFCPETEGLFPHDDMAVFSNRAVELLRNFHSYTKDYSITPIAVDFKYETVFEGTHNLNITGKIDLIKVLNDRTRSKETDLVFFSYSQYMPDEFISKIDINTTIAAYAFRRSFETKESNVIICNIGKKHETILQKSGSDFVRVRKVIYNIAAGIENKIFYPSDNRITCSRCKFKAFCLNERAMEDRDGFGKGFDYRK